MSKYLKCMSLSELEEKSDELYDEFSHVEFVQWLPGSVAEFYCV